MIHIRLVEKDWNKSPLFKRACKEDSSHLFQSGFLELIKDFFSGDDPVGFTILKASRSKLLEITPLKFKAW